MWLMAMLLPALLHFGLGTTRFPWPVILPLLLIGTMLASNRMVGEAAGDSTGDSSRD